MTTKRGTMTIQQANDMAIQLLDLRHAADDLLHQVDRLSKHPGLSAAHKRALRTQREKLLVTPSVLVGIAQDLREED